MRKMRRKNNLELQGQVTMEREGMMDLQEAGAEAEEEEEAAEAAAVEADDGL